VVAVLAALTLLLVGLVPTTVPPAQAAKPSVKITRSASKAVAGAAVKISGTVSGGKAKQNVTLEVKTPGGAWTKAATRKLNAKKRVAFTVRPALGTSQFRLVTTVKKATVRSKAVKVTVSPKVTPTGKVFAGQTVKVSGSLPTAVKRTVRLQAHTGKKWQTLASRKTTAKGAFTFSVQANVSAKVRVQAPKATVKKKKLAAFTSPTVSISTRVQSAKVVVDKQACTNQPLKAAVTSTSISAKRGVQIQLAAPGGAWRAVAKGTTTASGSVQVSFDAPVESGVYGVRAVVAKSGKVPAVASAAVTIDVADCGGPPAPEPPVVASGGHHTCALTAAQEIWCWGSNQHRQLADTDTKDRITPTKVRTSVKFRDVAASNYLSCGIDTNSRVLCWGTYDPPTVSSEWNTVRATPKVESGSLKFSKIAVGQYQVCGIAAAGQAWCWGMKKTGEAAGGGPYAFSSPVLVPGNRRYVDIVATQNRTCALTTAGDRWCWNGIGPADAYNDPPKQQPGSITFDSFSESCGLTAGGKAYCWGSDYFGQLGDGPGGPASSAEPVAVIGGHTFRTISSVGGLTGTACGLNTQARLVCWGYGGFGQMGGGTTVSYNSPYVLPTTLTFKQVSVGNRHVCAVRDGSLSVYCWGDNLRGQLGYGSIGGVSATPNQVLGL